MIIERIFFITLLAFSWISVNAGVEQYEIKKNWKIAPSASLQRDGKTLSSEGVHGSEWTTVQMPATIMGALVNTGVYPDIFYAKNLEKVDRKQFESSWWYCTTFELNDFHAEQEQVRLLFEGVNYRANVWLNGVLVADSLQFWNAFRQFDLDVTLLAGQVNHLAVEIIPPRSRDFYMGFVDWAPVPPDRNMGIYRPVVLKRTGKTSLDALFIEPKVDLSTMKKATVKIYGELTNFSPYKKTVRWHGRIEQYTLDSIFTLSPNEKRKVVLGCIEMKKPRLWWPVGMGSPELYTLQSELKEAGQVADRENVRFGIRQIETYLNEQNVRGYKINGEKVFIKSAGWVDDLFLRDNSRTNRSQIEYVKSMNLNSLRFEGVWGTSHEIYGLCDENGILLMVGWSCQWEWPDYLGLPLNIREEDKNLPIHEGINIYQVRLTSDEKKLMADMFHDQVRWLRNHPSIFVWATGSDAMPSADLEQIYHTILAQNDPTRSLLVSCGNFKSSISGMTGMKMLGPYDYVPPIYWYEDKKLGGAYGFNTETGPGPQIPPIESLRKMIPETHLWPINNEIWDYHSGRKEFNRPTIYLNALYKRYWEPQSLEELTMVAQLMNYEAIRPMFEAFILNRAITNGIVQWMLNSPWPEIYWQLYDWYLMPNAAFFGTMKACQPLNVIYNYLDHNVYLSNDTPVELKNATINIRIFDTNSKLVYSRNIPAGVAAGGVIKVDSIAGKLHQGVTFLVLTIEQNGKTVANNTYWISSKPDEMDWSRATEKWFYTPQSNFADYSVLRTIDTVSLDATQKTCSAKNFVSIEVILKNTTSKISFFNELMIISREDTQPVLPVIWSDNYITLIPGETRKVTAKINLSDLKQHSPIVQLRGINHKTITF